MNGNQPAGTDARGDAQGDVRGTSLAARLFISFALLSLLTLGTAAGVTVIRGNAVAEKAIGEQLAHSRSVQVALERARFLQLELITELFASDPYFSSYVAQAQQADLGFGGTADTASVTDLLGERQAELGFDFAIVLGAEGSVIARTDGRPVGNHSLREDVVVGPVIQSLDSSTGYWSQENGVFQVVAVPLADGFELAGFLVAGLAVDNALARELRQASGAHFLIVHKVGEQWRIAAGTPDETISRALIAHFNTSAVDTDNRSIELDGRQWRIAAAPLDRADAFAVTLTDEDAALAGYRAIQAVLALAALGALGAAVLLGGTIARTIARPVRELADVANAAANGDYHEALPRKGGRELSQLTGAFNRLLSDLREKRDMERFLADLARLQPEPGEQRPVDDGAVLAESGYLVGLRLKSGTGGTSDDQIRRIEEIANILTRCAAIYRARLLELNGNNAVLWIGGKEATPAIVMAGQTLKELQRIGVITASAVVAGDVIAGEIVAGGFRRAVWQAPAEMPLRQLLLEAEQGKVFLTRQAGESAKECSAAVEIAKGRVTGKSYFAMTANAAGEIGLADDDQTMAVTQVARTSASTAGLQLSPGVVFARRFEILSELGRGGMGAVFKALDRELNEPVALKVLLAGTALDAQERDAMKSEIRLARRITHPNILRTHDFGEFENIPFITMEYVRGLTLKFLIQQSGRLPDSAALRIARQIGSGLQAAHDQGVLHRDIKPENVILEPTGNAKLMDFGIAQVVAYGSNVSAPVAGTPRYAAPEQMLGEALDARADIYSLGVLMYQMFTGQLPFKARDMAALIALKREGVVVFPAGETRPAGIDELLQACLSGDPELRPASATLLLENLTSTRI